MPDGLTARRLLAWGDLDERRRRGGVRWLYVGAAVGALALAAGAWRLEPITASRLVLAACVGLYALVMLGAPFRLYWRRDSPLLARLPVPGRALFDVALVRSARASLLATLVVAPAAAALAARAHELALRHLEIVGATAVASALLLPAIALGAGALVAGGKADALVRAVGGAEVAAPPTAWLGMLPGLAAAAVVLVVIACGSWAVGDADDTVVGPAPVLLAALGGVSLLAALMARGAAAKVMPQAVREVAALDVQRLAHVEVHPPTAIERAIEARLGARAALVHGKDARLTRRRFPMAFVVGAMATGSWWLIAAVRPEAAWTWTLAIAVGFAAYAILVASRLVARPIELPYLATLPVSPRDAARAKVAYLATWSLLYPLLGVPALAVRLPDGPLVAAAVVATALAAIGLGARRIARA